MEIRTLRPDELEQAWRLDRESFHEPDANRERFLAWQDPERFVGAFEAGELVALSGVHELEQVFGGRPVPMGGLTSVSVAPHRRGEGLGPRVVLPCLEAMRARGQAISTLFPATTGFYRRLGWELAGAEVWRTVAPGDLAGVPRPESVRVRRADPGAADEAGRRACYGRMASGTDGFLVRDARWWEGLRQELADYDAFVAEDAAGEIVGTLSYRQLDGEYSSVGGNFQLACRELVWTTPDAARALVQLLASWATQVDRAFLRGGPEDPLLLLLPEQVLRPLAEVRWMTRIVDAPAAIAARGFPPGLDAHVSFTLDDAQLPDNAGAWTLRVEQGRGRLERGGDGALALGIGALASLYTGWARCAPLARAGLLCGGDAADHAAFDAAFAGPTPWMLDEF